MIKILLGKVIGRVSGRILVYDALDMKFSEVGLKKLEDREEINGLIDYQGFCAGHVAKKLVDDNVPSGGSNDSDGSDSDGEDKSANSGRTMDEAETTGSAEETVPEFHSIDPTEALEKLSNGWSPWVLDVRLQTEHDIVALPFTDQVAPHRTVQPDQIPKTGEVLVYCKAGVRGKKACNRLIKLGIDSDRLYNLDGGIMRWQKEIDPSMPRY